MRKSKGEMIIIISKITESCKRKYLQVFTVLYYIYVYIGKKSAEHGSRKFSSPSIKKNLCQYPGDWNNATSEQES